MFSVTITMPTPDNDEYRYMPGYGWITLADYLAMKE